MNTIKLVDGYGEGAEILHFFVTPLAMDETCVKLQCAEPGREYMIKWASKQDYYNALQEAIAQEAQESDYVAAMQQWEREEKYKEWLREENK